MLHPKLYLTDRKATETSIYAACYLQGKRKKIYLPWSVVPKQWDAKTQRLRRTFQDHANANHLLKKLVEDLESAYLTLTVKGQVVTPDDLKAVVARTLNGAQPNQPMGVLEHLAAWIEESRRDKAANTIRGYLTFQKHFLDFVNFRRLRVEFATLNKSFCESFKTYLLKNAELSNTSINNHIKNFKVFLEVTHSQGVHEFIYHKGFKKLEELEPDVIYLTQAEKEAIAALNFDYRLQVERTRDLFLFECETALRFSDMKALRPEQIKGDHILHTTQKTADPLKIPLSPLAKAILKKYQGQSLTRALPAKSNQKTNADLKLIAKLAKLSEPTSITQLYGTERRVTTRPKWAWVCTHTARRTFVTLALEGGMRPEVLMRITGHKTIQMLHRYLRITDAVVQNEFEQLLERQAAPSLR